jgi:putative heme-binding domain-containing protein
LKNEGNEVSDDGKVYVGGLALRIRPDGTHLKVYAHNFRNSYEVIPDSYGNLWQNDNDDQVVACRTTWIMEGGNAGYFSADGTRTWQADQRPGQDIFTAHWHQDDPGVMPAGDNSGAGAPTGITVIEGDELGPAYRGMLLSADAGRNIIFGYHPEVKLSGYDLGKRENFISSISDDNARYVWNDSTLKQQKEKWFRPSDVTIGTDGSIYVADWYDPVVGGHLMQDSVAYGRIYRITKKGKQMRPPKIALNTSAGQLLALKSPAINVRNAGFLKLKEQGQRSIALVIGLLDDPNPYIRARVIWLLSQLGPTGVSEVEKLLEDDDELIRATAYRALRQVVPDILPYAKKMIDDESPFVRREIAVSLGMLPYDAKSRDLLDLVKSFDGKDRWYLETIGAALEKQEATIYPEIKKVLGGNRPSGEWNKKMAMMAWRLHPAAAAKDLALRANDSDLDSADRQIALTGLAFVNDKEAAQLMNGLAESSLKDVSETARFWLSFRQNNDWAGYLDWSKIKMNTAYERRLAEMKVRLATAMDEQQSDYERKQQISEMAKDSIGGQMLIGLVSEKKLPSSLIAFVETKIFDNPDATVRAQAGTYFKDHKEKKLVASQIMKLKPDPARGEKIFGMRCSVCHQIAGKGNRVGPDLSSIASKFDDKELLDAIINPSSSIVFGYDAWLVNTRDNESVFGLMIAENKESVTIRDISGNNHVISRKNILSAKKRDKSLMPAAAQNGMNEQNLADVVGYLKKAGK